MKVSFMLDQSEMIEIESWSKKQPAKKALKELTALAEAHRTALLAQWQEIRDREDGQA